MKESARNYKWISYFFILVFCIPANIKYPGIVTTGIKLLSYSGYLFALLVAAKCGYYRRKIMMPLYCWGIWIVAATVINGTNVVGSLGWIAPLISSAILSFYLLERDREHFFYNISWIFTLLLGIQAFSLYTHIFGTYYSQVHWVNYYFFGIRVRVNKIIPFAVFFGMIAAKEGGKLAKLSLILSTAFGLYFVIGERVSTSIVGYSIIFIVFFATKIIKREHFMRNLSILVLFISVGFVFLYSGSGELANWFFGDILEEGATLNRRTIIWSQAIDDMKGIHWLIGNGYGNSFTFTLENGWEGGVTHNQYLETVFDFGFIGLSLYAWMCIRQVKRMQTKNMNFYTRVFYAVFIAIFFMQIPATLHEKPFYHIFYVACMFLPQASEVTEDKEAVNILPEQIRLKGIT